MSSTPSKPQSTRGAGCLVLFALPFAGFGLFMAWNVVSMVALAWSASSWEEVPATILKVKLKQNDESQLVVAEYQYAYDGVQHDGDRVGLSGVADNFSSYHEKLYKRLHDAWEAEKTVPCYVNPGAPTKSLLDRRLRPFVILFHLVFVLCFGGVGFGMIAGAVYSLRASRREAEVEQANPGKPWLLREEWRTGVLRDSRKEFYSLLVFAAFWNLISWPIGLMLLFGDKKVDGWWVYPLVLMFPAIGTGMIVWLLRQSLRRKKYGVSSLRLATLPGVVGGKLAGVIIAPAAVDNAEAVRLTLTCTRETGSGDDRKTELVWQDEREIGKTLAANEPGRVGVPVVFTIPSHVPETSPDKDITWTLKAKAALPGIDYGAAFEVPVFKTEESQEDVDVGTTPISPYEVDRPLAELLAREGILAEPLATLGGVRYFAPAGRYWGVALTLTLLTIVFGGAATALLYNEEWIIGSMCALTSFGLLLASLGSWLRQSELCVDGDRWAARSGWRGLGGRRREFDVKHVREVKLQTGSTSQTGTDYQRYHDVVAVLLGEPKPVKLLCGLRGTAAARKLVAELRRLAEIDSDATRDDS